MDQSPGGFSNSGIPIIAYFSDAFELSFNHIAQFFYIMWAIAFSKFLKTLIETYNHCLTES